MLDRPVQPFASITVTAALRRIAAMYIKESKARFAGNTLFSYEAVEIKSGIKPKLSK
jgi:hypothetical protein